MKTIFKKFTLKLDFSNNNFYIIRVWLSLLKTIFKTLKTKNKCLGDHFYFLYFFEKFTKNNV